eukprot:7458034-Pyramimonas_sp.AAC.1
MGHRGVSAAARQRQYRGAHEASMGHRRVSAATRQRQYRGVTPACQGHMDQILGGAKIAPYAEPKNLLTWPGPETATNRGAMSVPAGEPQGIAWVRLGLEL